MWIFACGIATVFIICIGIITIPLLHTQDQMIQQYSITPMPIVTPGPDMTFSINLDSGDFFSGLIVGLIIGVFGTLVVGFIIWVIGNRGYSGR